MATIYIGKLIQKTAIILGCLAMSACSVEQKVNQQTQVDWVNHYKSVEEMIKQSDAILIAEVIDQSYETRYDLVFTISRLKVISNLGSPEVNIGAIFEVLQTGGKEKDIETAPIEGVMMLSMSNTYLLFLELTIDGYYLIMGGFQGTALILDDRAFFPENNAFTENPLDGTSIDKVKAFVLNNR